MKILIAPDKFKGTLTATEVATAMAEGVRLADPDFEVEMMPLADGGEGTAELLTRADEGTMHPARAADPMFRQVKCQYGIGFDEDVAYIDLAEASGLQRLRPNEYNPVRATTLGTGELAVAALRAKCKTLVIGLGGSATMDAGVGIMHGLGFRFRDKGDAIISPTSGNLERIAKIDASNVHPRVPITKMILLADVDAPLFGAQGAFQFAAQKGLTDKQQPRVAAGLQHFAELLTQQYGVSPDLPGMGAAGGAALACVALMRAKIEKGANYIMKALDFKAEMRDADLVLTGEGCLDVQTRQGKVVGAVAQACAARKVPVIAIAGTVDLDASAVQALGLKAAHALYPQPPAAHLTKAEHQAQLTQAVTQLLQSYR